MAKLIAKIGSVRLFTIILLSIFSVELFFMLSLGRFLMLNYFFSGLVDASLLTITLFPILYFSIFRPLARRSAYYQKITQDLEKFKLAVANASDHIAITDVEGRALYMNKGAEIITGFKAKEVLGKKVGTKDLWGGRMSQDFYKKLWKRVKIDKKPFIGEINNHRKNGEKYIAKINISPILNKRGDVIFFVAIERDITKEKMINKVKSEFISLASHQLRTPLSAMKWTLEAFSGDRGLVPKHLERLKDLQTSNERLIALVNDLLNVSHIEDGKIIVKKETADVVKIMNEVLRALKINADKKRQQLKFNSRPAKAQASFDILRFSEAFNNLVANAINYAPEGQTIGISLKRQKNNYLAAVHNDEPIISPGDQAKLFTKFYRGTNSQIAKTTGSGLGLFIAKAAVEANGGKIWLESQAGAGTTFYFTVSIK